MRDDQKKEITLDSGKKISVPHAFNAGGIVWDYLGVGSSNVVYQSQFYYETDFVNGITLPPGKYVCKIQIDSLDVDKNKHSDDTEWRMSLPERAVRVYAECNSGLSAISYSILQKDFYNIFPTINFDDDVSAPPTPESQSVQAWISLFVNQKERPTPEIMINALAELYNKTGRILLDGVAPDNIMVGEVTVQNNANDITHFPNDRTVFSDIDYAVKLRRRTDDDGYESEDSGHYWEQAGQRCYRQYFAQWAYHPKHSVVNRFIKALLFLVMYYPEIRDVNLLKTNDQFVSILANAFDEMRLPEITEADNSLQKYFLEVVQPISLLQRMRCDKLNRSLSKPKSDGMLSSGAAGVPLGDGCCEHESVPALGFRKRSNENALKLMEKLCPDIDIHASDITSAQQADWMYWVLRISHLNCGYLNKLLTINEINWIKLNLFFLFEPQANEERDTFMQNQETRLCLLNLHQHNMPLSMRKIVYAFYNAPTVLRESGRLRRSSKSLSVCQQKFLQNSTNFFTEHSSNQKKTLIQVLSKLQGYCFPASFAALLYSIKLEQLLKLAPFFYIFTTRVDDSILFDESEKNKSQRELLDNIVLICTTDQPAACNEILHNVVRDCPKELINAFVALYLLRYTDKTEDFIRTHVMSEGITPATIIKDVLKVDSELCDEEIIQRLINVLGKKYVPFVVSDHPRIFAAQHRRTFQGTAGMSNDENAPLLSDDMPKEKQGCPCAIM